MASLAQADPASKIEAACKIALEPTPGLVVVLVSEAAREENVSTRQSLLAALSRVDARCCVQQFVGVMRDAPAADLRAAAAEALMSTSSPDAVDALMVLGEASTGEPVLLKEVARTLAGMKRPEAASALTRHLDTEDHVLFVGVAAGLANIGSVDAEIALSGYGANAPDSRSEVILDALSRIDARRAFGLFVQKP
jgi:HEAT repeat protein